MTRVPDPYGRSEVWVSFELSDGRGESFVRHCWVLEPFLEWLADGLGAFFSTALPASRLAGESFARAQRRLRQRDFSDESEADEWYRSLFEFRRFHDIRRMIPGALVPSIYVVPTGDDCEISRCDDACDYSTTLPLRRLCADLRDAIDAIVSSLGAVDLARLQPLLDRYALAIQSLD